MLNKFEVEGILQDKIHFPSKAVMDSNGEPVLKDGNIVMKKEFYMLKVAVLGDSLTFFVGEDNAVLVNVNEKYIFCGYLTSKGATCNEIKKIKEVK